MKTLRRTLMAIIAVTLACSIFITPPGMSQIEFVRADAPADSTTVDSVEQATDQSIPVLPVISDGTLLGTSQVVSAAADVIADNPTTDSALQSVSQALTAPMAITSSATLVTGNSAVLNGSFGNMSLGKKLSVCFEWGYTDKYGSTTALKEVKTSNGTFNAKLPALLPEKSYHFRTKVVGSDTYYGSDQTFTTTGVVMRLAGPAEGILLGSTFPVDIQIETDSQPVNSAAAYVRYDKDCLEVLEIAPDETYLSSVLASDFNNSRGELKYATLVPPSENPPSGTFKIATITFKYKSESSTTIGFDTQNPRKSDVAFGQGTVLGKLVEYAVTPKKEPQKDLQQGSGVVMKLVGPEGGVLLGSTFPVDIQIETGSQPVNSAAAYVNYDKNCLEVIQITPDEAYLNGVLASEFSNTRGELKHVAVVPPGEDPPLGTLKVATITFKYKAASSTNITFNTENPRKSEVAFGQGSVLGSLVNYTVTPKQEEKAEAQKVTKVTAQPTLSEKVKAASENKFDNVKSLLSKAVPDIHLVAKIIVGLYVNTPEADINGDGDINALDIIKLEMIAAGLK